MEMSFYMPMDSGSLGHYFSKAIILPAKYFTKKQDDIQNKFTDSLLLSERKWVKNSDCSIEVVLTDTEIIDLLKLSNNFFLYNTPIPISRVKSIWFLDSRQKDVTIWNINNGAAFIPEAIVSVESNANIDFVSDNVIFDGSKTKLTSELSDKIKKFDIILGGFAFMQVGGKTFMNYSQNYFSTLSYFNKLIEKQTLFAEKEKGLKFSNKYTGLFSKQEKSEWTKWQQYIYQNLDIEVIEALAEKEGVKIEKKLGILKIDSINPTSHLYELAILATYGANKTKSTDNLVTDLTNGTILADRSEDVSLLFGLNNGYFKLSNKYKGSEKYINVKFTLESKLDYYIIESIYQFVFNNSKQSYSFDYIDTWCPSINLKDKVKGYDTYKILDTVVIAKKKQTPLDFFLENYSGEIYSTITKSVNQWLAPFAKVEEKLLTEHFKKQFLKTFTNSIIEIQQKIESECEENNDSQMQHETTLHKNEIDKLLFKILNLQEENEKIKKEFNLLKISGHLSKPVQNTDDEKEIDQETSNLISTVEIYETNVSSNDNDKGIVFKDSISANMLQNNDVEISVKEESVSLRDLHNLKETEKILFNEYTIPLDLDKKDISEISVIEKLTSLPVFINPNNSEKENIKQPSAIDLIDNYLSLSFPKLKNIAKHRGISDAALQMFTKSNINELIALIRNTPEPPKLL